jgi:hypothetical protein
VKNIKNKIILILFLVLVFSCSKKEPHKTPIAKIYNKTLYLEDIHPSIYKNKKAEDSARALREYIENWANKELFIAEAKKNIDTIKINQLVTQYKNDLLKEKYLNKLTNKYLDTIIPKDSLELYYQKLKEIFPANDNYVQVYYLKMPKKNKKKYTYQKWFFDQKIAFQDSLFKHIGEFDEMDLSGQQWYTASALKQKFPVLKRLSSKQIIKKRKKIITTDSLSLYLMFINDVVRKGQALPLEFIQKDIKQLILSNRKEKIERKIINEMKEEAIKNKHFIIYSQHKEN